MAHNTTTPEAPIHDDVIEYICDMYEVDEDKFGEMLDRANARWVEFIDELKEHSEVIEETDDHLIVLTQHAEETRAMEKHVYSEMDIDIPDRHGSRANLLRDAHDRHVQKYEYDAFGDKQDAVDAVGAADPIMVNKPDQ